LSKPDLFYALRAAAMHCDPETHAIWIPRFAGMAEEGFRRRRFAIIGIDRNDERPKRIRAPFPEP